MNDDQYFFQKKVYIDKEITADGTLAFEYKLLGLARLDVSGLDIYKHFFPSFFQPLVSEKDQYANQFSCLFLTFARIFIWKMLMPRSTNQPIHKLIGNIIEEEFFKIKDLKKVLEREQIVEQTKEEQISEEIVLPHGLKSKQLKEMWSFIKKIGQEIEKDYVQMLGNAKFTEKYLQQKYQQLSEKIIANVNTLIKPFLPDLSQADLQKQADQKMYIVNNFNSIIKIDLLQERRKKELLKVLSKNNKPYRFKIPQLDSQEKGHTAIHYEHFFKKEHKPYIISFQNAVNHKLWRQLHKNNHEDKGADENGRHRHLCAELVKKLIEDCYRYNEKTKNFYPRLSLQDVFLHQLDLRVGVAKDKLILECLGLLHPCIKSIEARLAFEPTPTNNDDQCHLESDSNNQLKLKKKLYFDRDEKPEQNIRRQLEDNILCWRILDIAFFVFNQKHIVQHYYLQQVRKQQRLCTQTLKKVKQRVYEKVKNGEIPVAGILSDCVQNYAKDKGEGFGFSIVELGRLIGIQQNDSLLDKLQLQRRASELSERELLFKQIRQILSDQDYFKKLINVKRYIIIIMASYYEELYTFSTTRYDPNRQNADKKSQIKYPTGGYQEKISRYLAEKNGKNYQYIQNNSKDFQQFLKISSKFKEFCQEKAKKLPNKEEKCKKIEPEGQGSPDLMQTCIQLRQRVLRFFTFFVEKQVRPLLGEARHLHIQQNNCEGWKEFCLYLNNKLSLLIQLQLSLNAHNWKKYATLYKGLLQMNIARKKYSQIFEWTRKKKGRIKTMSDQLEMLQSWINEQSQSQQI